jgi:hypothetical protein
VTFPSVSVNTATARFGANSRIRWTLQPDCTTC